MGLTIFRLFLGDGRIFFLTFCDTLENDGQQHVTECRIKCAGGPNVNLVRNLAVEPYTDFKTCKSRSLQLTLLPGQFPFFLSSLFNERII